jgi:cyclophilin family peptidyl-prolyl cis-trans isomerase
MSNKNLIISAVVVLLAVGGIVWGLNRSKDKTEELAQEVQQESSEKTVESTCKRSFDENKFKTSKMETMNRVVELDIKNYGKVKISLDGKAAPKTAENFLKLVDSGFYNCLTFHRIAKGFVVQGGDPSGDGTGGPGYTLPAEISLQHKKGSIAMARLPDQVNPKRESSGSQFYIALQDLPVLDGQYTVFGQVTEGLDIIEKISQVEIIPGPFGDTDGEPLDPVIIETAKIVK